MSGKAAAAAPTELLPVTSNRWHMLTWKQTSDTVIEDKTWSETCLKMGIIEEWPEKDKLSFLSSVVKHWSKGLGENVICEKVKT